MLCRVLVILSLANGIDKSKESILVGCIDSHYVGFHRPKKKCLKIAKAVAKEERV